MIGMLWNQPQTDILVRNFDLRKLSTFVAGVVQDNALPVTTNKASKALHMDDHVV